MIDKKYNLIQILRGFAAIFVMLYHATKHYKSKELLFLNGFFDNGFFGVDIFFVLSGFVIYCSSKKHLTNGDGFGFLKRRLVRVYPSFWLFLLVPLTLVFIISPSFISDPSAFKFENYLKIVFLVFNHPQISQVTWTLSFEVYFYLLFFLLIYNKKFKIIIGGVLLISILNLLNKDVLQDMYLKKYIFSPLLLEFFLGVIIAFIIENTKKKNNFLFVLLFCLSIFLFVLIDFFIANQYISISKHYRVLSYGFASFFLILALVLIEKFNTIKPLKILILIGDSSYILYLIHSIILSFFDNTLILSGKLIFTNSQLTTILICVFILILSVFLHKFIEKPMLRLLNKKIEIK